MKPADYFEKIGFDGKVSCVLCPRRCIIENGKSGFCKVRKNIEGTLYSLNYGAVSAMNIDPVEKKPLFHFYPGKKILSIGSIGCNLKCSYCQNYEISQFNEELFKICREVKAEKIAEYAYKTDGNIGVAYTYNEPTVFFEYMKECAKEIKKTAMLNVAVTNGYIEEKPLRDSFEYIDAYSVDLKGFTEIFYKNITGGELEPVKKNLKLIRETEKHLEIENLIIPGLNDNTDEFEEMIKWINDNLGENTILHINRYYPAYKMDIEPAKEEKLRELYEIARDKLNFVYVGNIDVEYGRDTICPKCGNTVIRRKGYISEICGGNSNGECKNCGEHIFVI